MFSYHIGLGKQDISQATVEVKRPRGSLKHASSNLTCAVLVSEHVEGHFGLLPCKAVKAVLSASKGNKRMHKHGLRRVRTVGSPGSYSSIHTSLQMPTIPHPYRSILSQNRHTALRCCTCMAVSAHPSCPLPL